MKKLTLTLCAGLIIVCSALGQGNKTDSTDTAGNAVLFAGDNISSLTNDAGYLIEIGTGEQATNSALVFATNAQTIAANTFTIVDLTGVERPSWSPGWDNGSFLDTVNDRLVFTSSGPGKYTGFVDCNIPELGLTQAALSRTRLVTQSGTATQTVSIARHSRPNGGSFTPWFVHKYSVDITQSTDYVFFEVWHSDTDGGTETLDPRVEFYIQKVSTPPEEAAKPTFLCYSTNTTALTQNVDNHVTIDSLDSLGGKSIGFDEFSIVDIPNNRLVFDTAGTGEYEIGYEWQIDNVTANSRIDYKVWHVVGGGSVSNIVDFRRGRGDPGNDASKSWSRIFKITNSSEFVYFTIKPTTAGASILGSSSSICGHKIND